jgi:hypothetical protein
MLPCYLAVAFLLPDAQTNTATNKITSQTYCPPCQLGKLPSSKISMDILAPVPKTSNNLVPQLIKKATAGTLLLPANLTVLPESIPRPLPLLCPVILLTSSSLLPYPSFTESSFTPLPALVPIPDPSFNVYLLGIHRLSLVVYATILYHIPLIY